MNSEEGCTAIHACPPPGLNRVKDTEISVCEPPEGDCRRAACMLRSVPCRNRTTPRKQRLDRHLMSTVGLEGTKARSEHFIKDEDGILLRTGYGANS